MIAACCVKAAQTVNRMRALVDEGSDSNGIFGNENLIKIQNQTMMMKS